MQMSCVGRVFRGRQTGPRIGSPPPLPAPQSPPVHSFVALSVVRTPPTRAQTQADHPRRAASTRPKARGSTCASTLACAGRQNDLERPVGCPADWLRRTDRAGFRSVRRRSRCRTSHGQSAQAPPTALPPPPRLRRQPGLPPFGKVDRCRCVLARHLLPNHQSPILAAIDCVCSTVTDAACVTAVINSIADPSALTLSSQPGETTYSPFLNSANRLIRIGPRRAAVPTTIERYRTDRTPLEADPSRDLAIRRCGSKLPAHFRFCRGGASGCL